MSLVTVVGSFNVDHVWRSDELPTAGQTLHGEYSSGPGGKGFNQAIASARCDVPTHFICALGEDAGAQLATTLAREASLELLIKHSIHPTGTAGIRVDRHGHNSIVIGAGANADLDATFVMEHAAALQGSRVVLAQLETPLPTVTQALRLAHGAGVTTVFNPAPSPRHHLPADLLESVSIITPNETELLGLCDSASDLDVTDLDDSSLHVLCRSALPGGTVIVTLGSQGCFVSHGEDLHGDADAFYRVPAWPVTSVDTTGAGDAFNGSLCASLAIRSAPLRTHIEWASAVAGLSTENYGAAASMPDEATVTQRFGITLR